jgi:hypothetical protein
MSGQLERRVSPTVVGLYLVTCKICQWHFASDGHRPLRLSIVIRIILLTLSRARHVMVAGMS